MAGERQNALVQGVDNPFFLREKAVFQLRWRGDPVAGADHGHGACVMQDVAVQLDQEVRL